MHSFKYWILWLLLWQVASCSADNGVVCGPTAVDATINSATKSAGIIVDDEHVADDTPFGLSLHAYIYNGDFIGFKKQISVLSRHENFPSLLGALQAGDDRGITVVHLLACAGRHNELSNVVDVLFRMQGEGVEMIRRIVLETRNDDACRGKNCDLSSDRPGLYAHGTLHLRDPPQQVVLFGNVTPLECAAAHGHVQAMKRLIQCGVEAGRAFEIAKIFSLTKHLHQAIQLAHTEGFLAQPKVHLPSSSKSAMTLQRQCTIRASDTAQDTHSSDIPGSSSHGSVASKRKEKGVGGRSKQKSKQTPTEVAKTAAAVLMTVSGAAEAGSTPMSSSTASSDPGTRTGANTSKSTKLAEVLDIAALLLLTGMLLLPLWSTVCLLWRRAMRRRAAITEPARKIKQALFSATLGSAMRSMSSTSSRDNVSDCSSGAVAAAAAGSSSGSSSAAGQTTAGVKKGKASLGTLGRQRKAPVNQQKSNTATAAVAKPKVLIPMTVSCDDSDQAPAGCEEQQQLKPDVVPNDQLPHDSVMPPGQARSSSDPGTAALSSVPPQTTTACAASNRIKPNTAAIYRSTSDVVKSVSKSNKRNKQQASSAVGGDSGVSSAIDAPSLGALYNSSDQKTHPGSVATASSKSDLSMTSSVPQQQTVTAVDDRPEPSSKHVVPTPTESASCAADNAASNTSAGSNTSVSIPAQTASKRRTTGSRSVATSATAVKSHKDASQTPTAHNQIKTTSASSTSRRQLANRATSPVKAARSRPRASKSAGGAVGGTAAAAAAAAVDSFNRGKRGGLHAAQRTVSAGPTSGLYEPLLLSPAELRALSADDAAQAARAYAALITPYTPSASAAATRPAIYQPPGAKDGSSSNSDSRPIEADAGDVRGAQLRGMAKSDADSKVQQLKAELAANHDVDDVISCARDQDLGADASVTDFGADVSPYATALHIPADSGTLGGSADFEDTPPALSVCFSSPAALANEHSMGSSSSNSSSPKDLPSLQSQLSSSYSLGPICSSAEGSVPEAFNAAYLSSSSSSICSAAGAVCGPFKVSNAASLLSESSMPSSGMLADTSAAFAAQLPPPPPTTPSTAASRPITAATADRFGASSPDALEDDGMLSPARALSGTCGSKEAGLPSAAASTTTAIGSERPEMTHDTARSDTFAPQVEHLSVPQQNGTQLLSSSSSSARDAEQQLSALADVATADNIRSVASRTASGGSWSSGSVVTQGAGAQNAAVVLGSGDAEIPFQRRQSVSGPVCCSGLSEQMGFMTSVPQQQQEAATHSIRAIAQTLLQQPLPGASDAQAVQLSPEAVAQMVSRWHQQQQQQQQQQQMVARAQQQQQQQQRVMASIPQSAAWHEQQAAQQVLQVPAAAMHGGVQQVQLPASMLALMQASKHQAAVHQAAVQQQQQQHAQSQTLPQQQQQQKLMLFVPQQSGVQLVSPTNNSYTALSPQQRAVMLSPVAGVPAMQLMQQQQQQSAVSALPYAQQVQGAYLQQQQLQGVLQGGSVRVVYTADGRLHVQPHAIVANVSQGNNHHYTSAPMAISMPSASAAALLPSHMSTPGGLHLPSGVQQQQQQQQLLALMQPTQPGMQQAVQGGHSPTGFDWSSLASELSGGRVSTVVDAGSGEAADQTMLLRALASSSAVDAAAGGSSVGGTSVVSQSQQRLSVVVPESGSAGEQQKNESARMAAELDELLHQANQQLGWSGIPRPSDGDGVAAGRDHGSKAPTALPGMTSNFNMPAPTTADALLCQVGTYALQADAPEYQPSVLHAVGSQVSDTVCGGTASSEGKNVRLKNLEALQLPDGFCSGD